MAFRPAFNASQRKADGNLWFITHEEKLAVRQTNDGYSIPRYSDVKHIEESVAGAQYFGLKDGGPCFLADLPDPGVLEEGFDFRGIFELLGLLEDELLLVAGCAMQLIRWGRTHNFCGQCGGPTEDKADEWAKTCPDCGLSSYPRLFPAVIVAVVKDGKLLLGTSPRFLSDFWSVLAGFVEPGETLEECVVREVQEEVGITVKNGGIRGRRDQDGWKRDRRRRMVCSGQPPESSPEIEHRQEPDRLVRGQPLQGALLTWQCRLVPVRELPS